MDEEEIDAWYEEQKDKLTENYKRKLAQAEGIDLEKKEYDIEELDKLPKYKQKDEAMQKQLAKLHEKYKKEYLESMDRLYLKYKRVSERHISWDLRMLFLRHRLNLFFKKLLKPYFMFRERHETVKKES